jgi:hypothetical protein
MQVPTSYLNPLFFPLIGRHAIGTVNLNQAVFPNIVNKTILENNLYGGPIASAHH